MAKNKLPPGFSRFEFRPGVAGFPAWSGLDLRSDASASRANAFRVAKNVRLWGDDVIARGGQEKLNTEAIGPVCGIFDTDEEAGGEQKLWGFSAPFVPNPAFAGATWYTQSIPYGDATNGSAYLVAVGSAGGAKTIRIFRISKPIIGETNILYVPTRSAGDPWSLRAIGTSTGSESLISNLGLSYSAGTLTTPVGTAVAEMDGSWLHSATPTNWKVIVHYSEAGVVWFSGVETGGTNQRLYKADTNTNIFTLIGTFPFVSATASLLRHFHKFGTQLFAIRKTSGTDNCELVLLPSLSTVAVDSNFTTTHGNHNQSGTVATYNGKLYIAGHQTTPNRGAVIEVDSSYIVTIREWSAVTSEFVNLAVFGGFLYGSIAGATAHAKWDGVTWTSLGAFGGPGQFTAGQPTYFDPIEGRMSSTNDASITVSIIKRSAQNDLATAFSDFGTQTWGQPTSAPLYGQHAYFSVLL